MDECYCAQCGQVMPSEPVDNSPVMATDGEVSFPFPPMPASNVIQFPRRQGRPVMVSHTDEDVRRFAEENGVTDWDVARWAYAEYQVLKQRIAEEKWRRIAAEEDLI